MKFGDNFFADSEIDACGTSLRGYVKATRDELTEVFGNPQDYSLGDKVTTQWVIQFDSGSIATIYDWKRYELGRPGFGEFYEWHIGGNEFEVTELVTDALRHSARVIK